MALALFSALITHAVGSINSGPAALDGTGQCSGPDGKPAMKPFWDITDQEVEQCLGASRFHPSITEYFPGGGWSVSYKTRGGMPAGRSSGSESAMRFSAGPARVVDIITTGDGPKTGRPTVAPSSSKCPAYRKKTK